MRVGTRRRDTGSLSGPHLYFEVRQGAESRWTRRDWAASEAPRVRLDAACRVKRASPPKTPKRPVIPAGLDWAGRFKRARRVADPPLRLRRTGWGVGIQPG